MKARTLIAAAEVVLGISQSHTTIAVTDHNSR
jgi:hypothetical protein